MPNDSLVQEQDVKTTKRTGYGVVRFLLLGIVLGIVVFSIVIMVALNPASRDPHALDQIINVTSGMSGRGIADHLAEQGIVRDARLFHLLLRLTQTGHHLQAGDYLLNAQMTPMEVIERLQSGRVATFKVTIPEGYNLKQIAQVLADKGLVDAERFVELASEASLVYGEFSPLDLPIHSLEGYLFPDTYRFVKGQSEEEIIRQMVARFLHVADSNIIPLLEESHLTLHEVVTLASIVEKEIMIDRERPIVAGVYLNRLAIDMPLQADPTVRYVMTEDRSRVLYRDLEIDSPYNTYRYRGLPPGPIGSPGLASMEAVFRPADVEYLYFVSRGDGTHQFSRTFNEHVRARRALGY